MENKAKEKAKIYAEKKSSSKMFKDAHERDFIAGYNQAIEDSCAPEMLQMLKDILDNNRQYWGEEENSAYQIDEIEELIKKATTI